MQTNFAMDPLMTLAAPLNQQPDLHLLKRQEVSQYLSHNQDLDKTDQRILHELFPDRSLTTNNLMEVNPNRQRNSSRNAQLRLKPAQKKELIEQAVNLKLAEMVASLED
jgi:phosphatidate phosphatase PAH1